jgi:hypothetical protein
MISGNWPEPDSAATAASEDLSDLRDGPCAYRHRISVPLSRMSFRSRSALPCATR